MSIGPTTPACPCAAAVCSAFWLSPAGTLAVSRAATCLAELPVRAGHWPSARLAEADRGVDTDDATEEAPRLERRTAGGTAADRGGDTSSPTSSRRISSSVLVRAGSARGERATAFPPVDGGVAGGAEDGTGEAADGEAAGRDGRATRHSPDSRAPVPVRGCAAGLRPASRACAARISSRVSTPSPSVSRAWKSSSALAAVVFSTAAGFLALPSWKGSGLAGAAVISTAGVLVPPPFSTTGRRSLARTGRRSLARLARLEFELVAARFGVPPALWREAVR